MQKTYIGEKEVLGVTTAEKKTPAGAEMLSVMFDNGKTVVMPKAKFDLIKTDEPSDASKVQDTVKNAFGSIIYGLMQEYGLTFFETNGVLDKAAEFVQAAADKATNILFGVEYPEDRTVNQLNDILLEHANKIDQDGTASSGSGSSSENKE